MNQPIKHFIKPFIKCSFETTISEAAAYMSRKKQNIIFVNQDKNIIGVINDSDLRQRVLANELDTKVPVSQVMTAPVKSIKDNTLLYEAMLIFNSENISHLAVKDNMNNIVGMVSNEDILNLHKNSLSYLVKEIEDSENVEQLQKIQERIPVLVKALLDSGAKTQNITRIISSVADAITEKLIVLAIEEYGKPPCEFAFIVMGSEGRKEQTLATDQDNAIILENLDEEKLVLAKEYFQNVSNKINKNLDYVGFNYCIGGIMAKNPKYTQPLDKWKEYFKNWMVTSSPQTVIDASIFFDFRFVYGNPKLVEELQHFVHEISDKHPVFQYHMAQSIINYKSPFNIKQFNVKNVLLPFVGFIKTYNLKYKIKETNTLERLEKLFQQQVVKKDMYEELLFAYDFLMTLRFKFQVESIFNRDTPSNEIDGEKLTDIEKTTLKKIFSELSTLQTKLGFDFKGGVN
jgi:signal-transduction protein with cAMP-binding, CBS, and nucleotidyltransferase domain